MTRVAHSPITILAPRTQPNHAATVQDINDAIGGRIKSPVRVVSTANEAGIYDGNTMTLKYGANGALVIDGVALVMDDRVLLTGQTDGTQNGIYTVLEPGSASTPAELTRAADFDYDNEILPGVRINVDGGTLFAASVWMLATQGTIILDTTVLEFVKVSANAGTAKYAETITGDGLRTDFNIQHDLGTTDISVTVRNVITNFEIIVDWQPVDSDNAVILFAVAPSNTMSFRVVVIG